MELVLKNVGFSYDCGLPTEKKVLESVSLRVGQGELVSVLGRTGSGKTTLGLLMAGLLKPQRGEVTLNGPEPGPPVRTEPLGGDSSLAGRPRAVMVFQVPESQFFEETVFDEVAFGPSRSGLAGSQLCDRVFSSLERLGLDALEIAHRSPTRLCEGEKRKVAIASALSCRPLFLVLDEPTVSLDWEATAHLFTVLKGFKETGVSVIVMTHEVESALAYSDRVEVLAFGRVRASGRLAAAKVYECWLGEQ
jgi:energy-coupling factor transport system ATP-binding protein